MAQTMLRLLIGLSTILAHAWCASGFWLSWGWGVSSAPTCHGTPGGYAAGELTGLLLAGLILCHFWRSSASLWPGLLCLLVLQGVAHFSGVAMVGQIAVSAWSKTFQGYVLLAIVMRLVGHSSETAACLHRASGHKEGARVLAAGGV